jgi:hypothetical protein
MAPADLRRQFRTEDRQLLSFRRANVCRQVSGDRRSQPPGSEENQLRERGGGQPGETAAIVNAIEGQAAVAVQTVPAQVGGLERLAAHGLHRVPEERRDFTDLDGHAGYRLQWYCRVDRLAQFRRTRVGTRE